MQLTLASVLALTPVAILPRYFFYFDVTPKIAVTLIGTAIGLLLLTRASMPAEIPRLWADPLGRWFSLLSAAQLISLLVSTALSINPALSWNGGNWRRLGLVSQSAVIAFGFLVAAASSEFALRVLLRASSAAGTATALYGILQYFGFDPLLPAASYRVGEGVLAIVRPPSMLGHADYFAGYLLYVVFFGGALLATETKRVWRALGVTGTSTGIVAIVLSGTRGAVVGLVVGALSLWVWKRRQFRRGHAVLAAGVCALAVAFYFSPAGLQLRARRQWVLEDLRGGARLSLWRDSIRMADQHMLIGYGPETFGLEFPKYQSTGLSRAYPDFYHESPHNIFLDALVSQGIAGIAILVGFMVVAGFAARRAVSQGQRTAPYLVAAMVAGLTASLLVSFTLPGALYFYATIAMLIGLVISPKMSLTGPQSSVRLHVPVLALSLMAFAIILYFTVRLTMADLALGQAKRELDSGRIEDALVAYASSLRWHPGGSSDDLYFSRALAAASLSASNPGRALLASQQAFSLAQRATKTSEEQQNAWYNLAAFYATQNDAAHVEACLRRSVDASPNWFKSHWALAQLLELSGRRTEALAEAARAADLDGGKDPDVAKFLQSVHHQAGPPTAE